MGARTAYTGVRVPGWHDGVHADNKKGWKMKVHYEADRLVSGGSTYEKAR